MTEFPEFESPNEGLGHFFDSIWGSIEGYVQIPTKDPATNDWQRAMFKWPKARKGIIKYVLAQTAEGKDVYYGPALYASNESTDKENLLGTQVLWAEFDGNAQEAKFDDSDPGEDREGTSETPEQAAQEQGRGIPGPTLRVQTSGAGNQHVYWRLDSFHTDIEKIEEKNRSLAYSLNTDKSGWDATQVLRPPYTSNYKYSEQPPVRVIGWDKDKVLPFDAFGGLKSVKVLVNENLSTEDLPKVEWVIAKYKWDDKHFDLLINGVEEGERSTGLMRLGFFGAEAGMTDQEIYAVLKTADARWGKFKNRTDQHRRLLDIINRARQKHPVGVDSPEALAFAGLQQSPIQQSPQTIYGFEDFLNTKIHIEWAIEGLLEVAGMGIITGPPGVGKTQFLLQTIIHMALGKDFLGWKVTGRNKVLLLSLEMNHPALDLFVQNIAGGLTQAEIALLQRNLQIGPLGRGIPFDSADGIRYIEYLLQTYQPTVLAIDSLGKTSDKSLEESTVKLLNKWFVHFRQKYGCSLLFVHHNRKANGDNKKPKELGDLYGSQYVAAEASSVIGLWREEKGTIEVSLLKSRLAEEIDPFHIKRIEHLAFERKQEFTAQGMLNSDNKTQEPEVEHKPEVKPAPNTEYKGNGTFGFEF